MYSNVRYIPNKLKTPCSRVEKMARHYSTRIITDHYPRPRQSKNTGYVEMSVRGHGRFAIAALNGKNVNNRQLVVRAA